jgi:hypothetical protein
MEKSSLIKMSSRAHRTLLATITLSNKESAQTTWNSNLSVWVSLKCVLLSPILAVLCNRTLEIHWWQWTQQPWHLAELKRLTYWAETLVSLTLLPHPTLHPLWWVVAWGNLLYSCLQLKKPSKETVINYRQSPLLWLDTWKKL